MLRGTTARARYGRYILIEPFTKHDNFRWPLERWADLVDACPDLTFVQHLHQESPLVPGVQYEAAGFRDACGLVAACSVYVRSESGLCHAAAALGASQVTLFGGCMDPEVMGYYDGQTVIADTGPESPCGRWLSCAHCRACMDRITVEDVATALRARLAARKAA
jgi:ADP-heptose:LPS heptosyltransferase